MVERAQSQSVAGLIEKSARRGRRNAEDGGKKLVEKRTEVRREGVDEMPREMMKGYLSAIKFHLCGKSVRSRHSRVEGRDSGGFNSQYVAKVNSKVANAGGDVLTPGLH